MNKIITLSFALFAIGTAGIIMTSTYSTLAYAKQVFIISSLLLGGSILAFLFGDLKKWSRVEYLFLVLLFLISIIKVLGIHLKYGIYMGADAFVEYNKITWILDNQHVTVGDDLSKTPFAVIYTAVVSLLTGVEPLSGSFSLVHLVTNAMLSVGAYVLIRNSFDPRVAVIGAFILAYHPTSTVLGLSMTRENVALVFFMLGMIIIIKQLNAPKITYLLFFSILSVSLILSHYTTAYFSAFILAATALLLFSLHIKLTVKKPKILLRLFTPLIFFAIFIPFHTLGLYPQIGTAENLTKSAIRFLLEREVVLITVGVLLLYLLLYKASSTLLKNRQKELLLVSGVGIILALVAWLKIAPSLNFQLHYQSIAILIGTSFVDVLYKIYAFFFVAGSAFCFWEIVKKRMSREQSILALVGIFSILIGVVWVVSGLSTALEPHRALRFAAVIGSLVTAFLLVYLYKGIRSERARLIYAAFILMIFAFPITAYLTDYMAFYADAYPSKLHDNMYNIRAGSEIITFDFMKGLVQEKSNIVVEFNRGEDLLSRSSQNKILMTKTVLLAPKEDFYLFLRKSLFKYRQYLQYPEGSYFLTPPQVVELKDEEFNNLISTIEKNNVVYSQDSYKLVHIKYPSNEP